MWATGNASIVTVGNGTGSWGLARGVSVGSATVSATLSGLTGQTTITIVPPVLTSIVVTPSNSTIAPIATKQYTATGVYNDGSTVNLTTSVTWSSSNALAASINTTTNKGRATGGIAGSTTITAALGSLSGTTQLTCTLL